MSAIARDPGSFRDPGGRVYSDGARIFRTVNQPNAQAYEQARDSGLLARLAPCSWPGCWPRPGATRCTANSPSR